jgi:hypothetical protein
MAHEDCLDMLLDDTVYHESALDFGWARIDYFHWKAQEFCLLVAVVNYFHPSTA